MALPAGTVTFLFSDLEGSTRLARSLGDARWAEVLRAHDAAVDAAVDASGGVVVKHEGDGAFAAFADAGGAVEAAVAIARALAGLELVARIGLHAGQGRLTDAGTDYVGVDVHYAARLAAAANGGQVVLSDSVVAIVRDRLPPGTTLADEGRRRVRDFEEPRAVARLVVPGVADDARPLRTTDAPSNLPELVTTFVGRESELADVAGLLASARILTLTGPGGSGKTRLALRLAAAVADAYPDGTWFVELAPVRDPGLVHGAIADALGVRAVGDEPVAAVLEAALRERTCLIVLDNLEQLLPAAAAVVAGLARTAPGVRLVVTSREVLRVSGEQEYRVPPLDGSDAIRLFVDRARLVRPEFALTDTNAAAVTEVCRRLDGLPLAIELAAARIRLFSPDTILERLGRSLDLLAGGGRDLPERQRTLRGAIAWSHDLLSEPERALFRRLAVFTGGWTAEAAAAVVDPAGDLGVDVADGLESLADKSLARIDPTEHGDPRFERHAFIREFAAEQLDASGERPACERRHAEVFVALAQAAGPHLIGAAADDWIDRLDHDQHNLRAAIRWSLAAGEPALGMRLIAAAWRWWQHRARLADGRALVEELLADPRAAEADPRARIGALAALGGLTYWATDYQACRRAYEQRSGLAEADGDPLLVADAHYDLSFVFLVENDLDGLLREAELAEALYRELGDDEGVVKARQSLVVVDFLSGRIPKAIERELLNLATFRADRSWFRIADSTALLAAMTAQLGDFDAARGYLGELLDVVTTHDSALNDAAALAVAGFVAGRAGDAESAARLSGATHTIVRDHEVGAAPLFVLHLTDPEAIAAETVGDARAGELATEGGRLSRAEAMSIAGRVARGEPMRSTAGSSTSARG